MPDWLIDLLAGLSVARAVFLAAGLFGASLVPFFALIDSRGLQQFVVHARHDAARWSVASMEAFRDLAALFLLLFTRPQGALS